MPACESERGSACESACVDVRCILEARLATRQRAGLVENHSVDLGQAFEAVGRLDDDALGKQAARGRHLHGGHGKRQGAGARDDENGDGARQRLLPAAAGQHPANEGGGAENMDGGA